MQLHSLLWSAQRQQSGDQSMRRIDLFALEAEDK